MTTTAYYGEGAVLRLCGVHHIKLPFFTSPIIDILFYRSDYTKNFQVRSNFILKVLRINFNFVRSSVRYNRYLTEQVSRHEALVFSWFSHKIYLMLWSPPPERIWRWRWRSASWPNSLFNQLSFSLYLYISIYPSIFPAFRNRIRMQPDPLHLAGSTSFPAPDPDPDPLQFLSSDPEPFHLRKHWFGSG